MNHNVNKSTSKHTQNMYITCLMSYVLCLISYIFCINICIKICTNILLCFSKHRPSGPLLSISRNVRLCVRLSVCLSVHLLLRYHLTVFLPPLPKVGCQIFLEIRNPWGKSNGKKWSNIWTFVWKWLKNRRKKKVVFCWFCLTKHGGNHASRWIRDLWSKGVSLILAYL